MPTSVPPKTVRQRADECRSKIEELEAEKANAKPAERRRIDERIAMMRELEEWFRSRRGYE